MMAAPLRTPDSARHEGLRHRIAGLLQRRAALLHKRVAPLHKGVALLHKGVALLLGCLALSVGVAAVRAQSTDGPCGPNASEPCQTGSAGQGSGQVGGQVGRPSPDQNLQGWSQSQSQDQDSNQSQDQGWNQNQDQNWNPNQDPNQGQPGEATPQQLIEILRQNPQVLVLVSEAAAARLGTDPSSVSDDEVYDLIRDVPEFRTEVATRLTSFGYLPAAPPTSGLRAGGTRGRPESSRMSLTPEARPFRPAGTETLEQSPVSEQSIPYQQLPSLRDLYSQVRPENLHLSRFGSDVFLDGTGNSSGLPMDLPAGPDYVLGPGDSLILNLWGGLSARLDRTVDRQGDIAVPEAGTLPVAGLTIVEAQEAVAKTLATQFQHEHVELSLGRIRSVRVYVVGDVQRPGGYDVSSLSTPLNALCEAGGPTSRGSMRRLLHYRGEKLVREIDLYDFLLHGVRSDAERLLPGDTLLVPPAGAQVAIAGMVRRPAIYELGGPETLAEVLATAGGVRVSGSLGEIRVERIVAHQRRSMLSVRLPDGLPASAASLPSLPLQDGDQIIVAPILPYNDQAVYLEGHVYRPGRYPWREGMTVADLLHSSKDLLPEAAARAQIVRLEGPDLHPAAIDFDVAAQLIGNDPIVLQPFDVVRLFGRYQFDPPMVSVYGEVLRPGKYPMSRGMTVADLVRIAGGFKRGAYVATADLSTYSVTDGQRVLLHHAVVAMQKALDGDSAANLALRPGDVLGIRQITGWNDVGASVTLSGEVRYAGTYGIEEGERLSSLLERAGGIRSDGYPEGADLARLQVREVEQQSRQQMIERLQSSAPALRPGSSPPQDQLNLLQTMQQQQQQVLTSLRSRPSSGRLVIRISADVASWKNTPADIEMRAGDTLVIPKRPDFVMVTGQVFNSTAIAWVPGRNARWYLDQAGGATRSADRKEIFIVRANGSVVGHGGQGGTLWSRGSVFDIRMQPGDSVVVPEKVIGGSMLWRNLLGSAQIMSSVAVTGAAAGIF